MSSSEMAMAVGQSREARVRCGSIATGAGQQRVRPCPLCPESEPLPDGPLPIDGVALPATRYDKLGANYLAFIQLASIRLWLRAL
jgi:hypothetical protein